MMKNTALLVYEAPLVSDGHSTNDNRFLGAAQSIAYYNTGLDGSGMEDGFGRGQGGVNVKGAAAIVF